mmetsp:Transcript_74046/g.217270  ORF Transcript_74046/g.217270 Transcript_74046/m.217270 type:complete len:373 (-) Transcript_74046:104-1222(-)
MSRVYASRRSMSSALPHTFASTSSVGASPPKATAVRRAMSRMRPSISDKTSARRFSRICSKERPSKGAACSRLSRSSSARCSSSSFRALSLSSFFALSLSSLAFSWRSCFVGALLALLIAAALPSVPSAPGNPRSMAAAAALLSASGAVTALPFSFSDVAATMSALVRASLPLAPALPLTPLVASTPWPVPLLVAASTLPPVTAILLPSAAMADLPLVPFVEAALLLVPLAEAMAGVHAELPPMPCSLFAEPSGLTRVSVARLLHGDFFVDGGGNCCNFSGEAVSVVVTLPSIRDRFKAGSPSSALKERLCFNSEVESAFPCALCVWPVNWLIAASTSGAKMIFFCGVIRRSAPHFLIRAQHWSRATFICIL